ncbi:hypothetical protein Acsp01_80130 [Actinoplanes sp. NBRC 101535]|nr:hypothetical protein Acsp01_80130 [Actinoplanes sp. NBRC 101535]
MEFLRNEALKDPAAARIFWLAEYQGIQDYSASKALLDDLVHQASLWTPDNRWVVVAQLLQKFVEQLSEPRRDRLVDQLAKIFIEYGQTALAEEINHSKGSFPNGPRA